MIEETLRNDAGVGSASWSDIVKPHATQPQQPRHAEMLLFSIYTPAAKQCTLVRHAEG